MRQKLGQYFLKQKNVTAKIVAALELQKDETVVEIGPGRGALTTLLVKQCEEKRGKVIAIERDEWFAETLRTSGLCTQPICKTVFGNALVMLPEIVSLLERKKIQSYKLIGNIPYSITGKLLRILSELEWKPTRTVLTLQEEVAERIVAEPPRMNLLAAVTQFWAMARIVGRLPREAFDPPPRVRSAIIRLDTKLQQNEPELAEYYYAFIKTLFKQPRKTVLNNIRVLHNEDRSATEQWLKSANVDPNARPQDLPIKVLINLATTERANMV